MWSACGKVKFGKWVKSFNGKMRKLKMFVSQPDSQYVIGSGTPHIFTKPPELCNTHGLHSDMYANITIHNIYSYTCCVRAAVAEQPDVVTEQRVVRAAPGDEWTLSTTDGRTPSRLLRDRELQRSV
jgi:hypothetical protein